MIREDSLVNISGELYREFGLAHDQKVLDAFGGGGVHYCGRGDHFIEYVSDLRGLYAVNLGQPECNDMGKIYTHTVDKGIQLQLDFNTVERAIRSGRKLDGMVFCIDGYAPSETTNIGRRTKIGSDGRSGSFIKTETRE